MYIGKPVCRLLCGGGQIQSNFNYSFEHNRKGDNIVWQQKGCPKCNSDIFIYQTVSGENYEMCFRCGYRNRLGSRTSGEKVDEGLVEPVGDFTLET
jgi:hypothetical protein